MWKLKIAEGGPWLTTTNNYIGRQHWEFDPDAGTPEERKNRFKIKQSSDRLMRMQFNFLTTTTLRRGIGFFSSIQAHDGHWPAESAGPLFWIQPLVMALYVSGGLNTVFPSEHQKELVRYLYNHQNEDGGWGFHIEGPSTIFGSTFSYICLRLLGQGIEDGEDMAMARGRKWILDTGGLVGIPSWGKFWVAVLGLYEWSGCNPLSPEFWLLPQSFPVHPGNMLSYARLVYMPMSYLYGKRFVGPITGLIQSLRQELYTEPYHQINWNKARNTVAKEDLYYPHPLIQDLTWGFLHYFVEPILTRWPFSIIREKALRTAMEHIHYEDENSRYMCIGSVEKALCLMACWVEDPNSEAYKHLQTFGCQMWDAGFAIQAIMSSNLSQEYGPTLHKAHDFVKASQVRENPSGNFEAMYRFISKGSWTFSNQDHGWQVSDCTSEGLKCSLLLSQMPTELVGEKMETERLYDAVNVILSLQSSNGGFPAWEPQRAYRWLEKFNPTEVFEDTLIEREYVECTSSAIQGLALFRKFHPSHRRKEIDAAIARGAEYIEDTQNPDGSWYGCWGICYTYGTWFAVEGLASCGRNHRNSPTLNKAREFLISKQLSCGGWGESYLSSQNKAYTNLKGDRSHLVQTAWAVLALINAGQAEIDATPIHKGIRVLINSQMDDGDFPQQEMTGAFMKNCALNYSSYRNIFPIWALGEYRRKVLYT
ncbi:hypothetical protein K2173_021122 [Erythroxylum novogranatense]|uniref:Terpene cyclase/mutase family member n=1 Tax=Erythroxylum novogranatense TaxID=1862640 RepID=A0AAV8TMU8_9ROSI|nr:hypothetical protein K2173_021122 [Erythroxylum novogranatense]